MAQPRLDNADLRTASDANYAASQNLFSRLQPSTVSLLDNVPPNIANETIPFRSTTYEPRYVEKTPLLKGTLYTQDPNDIAAKSNTLDVTSLTLSQLYTMAYASFTAKSERQRQASWIPPPAPPDFDDVQPTKAADVRSYVDGLASAFKRSKAVPTPFQLFKHVVEEIIETLPPLHVAASENLSASEQHQATNSPCPSSPGAGASSATSEGCVTSSTPSAPAGRNRLVVPSQTNSLGADGSSTGSAGIDAAASFYPMPFANALGVSTEKQAQSINLALVLSNGIMSPSLLMAAHLFQLFEKDPSIAKSLPEQMIQELLMNCRNILLSKAPRATGTNACEGDRTLGESASAVVSTIALLISQRHNLLEMLDLAQTLESVSAFSKNSIVPQKLPWCRTVARGLTLGPFDHYESPLPISAFSAGPLRMPSALTEEATTVVRFCVSAAGDVIALATHGGLVLRDSHTGAVLQHQTVENVHLGSNCWYLQFVNDDSNIIHTDTTGRVHTLLSRTLHVVDVDCTDEPAIPLLEFRGKYLFTPQLPSGFSASHKRLGENDGIPVTVSVPQVCASQSGPGNANPASQPTAAAAAAAAASTSTTVPGGAAGAGAAAPSSGGGGGSAAGAAGATNSSATANAGALHAGAADVERFTLSAFVHDDFSGVIVEFDTEQGDMSISFHQGVLKLRQPGQENICCFNVGVRNAWHIITARWEAGSWTLFVDQRMCTLTGVRTSQTKSLCMHNAHVYAGEGHVSSIACWSSDAAEDETTMRVFACFGYLPLTCRAMFHLPLDEGMGLWAKETVSCSAVSLSELSFFWDDTLATPPQQRLPTASPCSHSITDAAAPPNSALPRPMMPDRLPDARMAGAGVQRAGQISVPLRAPSVSLPQHLFLGSCPLISRFQTLIVVEPRISGGEDIVLQIHPPHEAVVQRVYRRPHSPTDTLYHLSKEEDYLYSFMQRLSSFSQAKIVTVFRRQNALSQWENAVSTPSNPISTHDVGTTNATPAPATLPSEIGRSGTHDGMDGGSVSSGPAGHVRSNSPSPQSSAPASSDITGDRVHTLAGGERWTALWLTNEIYRTLYVEAFELLRVPAESSQLTEESLLRVVELLRSCAASSENPLKLLALLAIGYAHFRRLTATSHEKTTSQVVGYLSKICSGIMEVHAGTIVGETASALSHICISKLITPAQKAEILSKADYLSNKELVELYLTKDSILSVVAHLAVEDPNRILDVCTGLLKRCAQEEKDHIDDPKGPGGSDQANFSQGVASHALDRGCDRVAPTLLWFFTAAVHYLHHMRKQAIIGDLFAKVLEYTEARILPSGSTFRNYEVAFQKTAIHSGFLVVVSAVISTCPEAITTELQHRVLHLLRHLTGPTGTVSSLAGGGGGDENENLHDIPSFNPNERNVANTVVGSQAFHALNPERNAEGEREEHTSADDEDNASFFSSDSLQPVTLAQNARGEATGRQISDWDETGTHVAPGTSNHKPSSGIVNSGRQQASWVPSPPTQSDRASRRRFSPRQLVKPAWNVAFNTRQACDIFPNASNEMWALVVDAKLASHVSISKQEPSADVAIFVEPTSRVNSGLVQPSASFTQSTPSNTSRYRRVLGSLSSFEKLDGGRIILHGTGKSSLTIVTQYDLPVDTRWTRLAGDSLRELLFAVAFSQAQLPAPSEFMNGPLLDSGLLPQVLQLYDIETERKLSSTSLSGATSWLANATTNLSRVQGTTSDNPAPERRQLLDDILDERDEGKKLTDTLMRTMRSSVTESMRPALKALLAVLIHRGLSSQQACDEIRMRWMSGEWATKLQGESRAAFQDSLSRLARWLVSSVAPRTISDDPLQASGSKQYIGTEDSFTVGPEALASQKTNIPVLNEYSVQTSAADGVTKASAAQTPSSAAAVGSGGLPATADYRWALLDSPFAASRRSGALSTVSLCESHGMYPPTPVLSPHNPPSTGAMTESQDGGGGGEASSSGRTHRQRDENGKSEVDGGAGTTSVNAGPAQRPTGTFPIGTASTTGLVQRASLGPRRSTFRMAGNNSGVLDQLRLIVSKGMTTEELERTMAKRTALSIGFVNGLQLLVDLIEVRGVHDEDAVFAQAIEYVWRILTSRSREAHITSFVTGAGKQREYQVRSAFHKVLTVFGSRLQGMAPSEPSLRMFLAEEARLGFAALLYLSLIAHPWDSVDYQMEGSCMHATQNLLVPYMKDLVQMSICPGNADDLNSSAASTGDRKKSTVSTSTEPSSLPTMVNSQTQTSLGSNAVLDKLQYNQMLAAGNLSSLSSIVPNDFSVAIPSVEVAHSERGIRIKKSSLDTAALRANDCWPLQIKEGAPMVYYYEVTLRSAVRRLVVGLTQTKTNGGFNEPNEKVSDVSFGYDTSGSNQDTGAPPFGEGDTAGCGVVVSSRKVFYTLNGVFQGFAGAVLERFDFVYPMIVLENTERAKLNVNFGSAPFMYDYRKQHPALRVTRSPTWYHLSNTALVTLHCFTIRACENATLRIRESASGRHRENADVVIECCDAVCESVKQLTCSLMDVGGSNVSCDDECAKMRSKIVMSIQEHSILTLVATLRHIARASASYNADTVTRLGSKIFESICVLMLVPLQSVQVSTISILPEVLPLLQGASTTEAGNARLVQTLYRHARSWSQDDDNVDFVPKWEQCDLRSMSVVHTQRAHMLPQAQRSIVLGTKLPRTGEVSFEVKIVRKAMSKGHSLKGGYYIGVSVANLTPQSPQGNSQSWKATKPPIVWALHDTSPQLPHALNPTVKPNNFHRTFCSGDIIRVVVNRDRQAVSFYREGEFLKELFHDLPADIDLVPFVQLYNDDASVLIGPGKMTAAITAPAVLRAVSVDVLRNMLTDPTYQNLVASHLCEELRAEPTPTVTLSLFNSLPDPRNLQLQCGRKEVSVTVRRVTDTRCKFSIGDHSNYDMAQNLRVPSQPWISGALELRDGHATVGAAEAVNAALAVAAATNAGGSYGQGASDLNRLEGVRSCLEGIVATLQRLVWPLVTLNAIESIETDEREKITSEEYDAWDALFTDERISRFIQVQDFTYGSIELLARSPSVPVSYAFCASLSHPGFVLPRKCCGRLAMVPSYAANTTAPFIVMAEPALPSSGVVSVRCQFIRGNVGQILGGGYYFGVCAPTYTWKRKDMNTNPPDVWALHDMDEEPWRLQHFAAERRPTVVCDPKCILVSGDVVRLEIDRDQGTMQAFRHPPGKEEVSFGVIFDNIPKTTDLHIFVHLYNTDAVAVLLPPETTSHAPLRTTQQMPHFAMHLSAKRKKCDGCAQQHMETTLQSREWYRCNECVDYNLCHQCFHSFTHVHHSFTKMDECTLAHTVEPPMMLEVGMPVVVSGTPSMYLSRHGCDISSLDFNCVATSKMDDAFALWGLVFTNDSTATFTVSIDTANNTEISSNRPVYVGVGDLDMLQSLSLEELTAKCFTCDSSIVSFCSDPRIRRNFMTTGPSPYGFSAGATITLTINLTKGLVTVTRNWIDVGSFLLPSQSTLRETAKLAGFVVFGKSGVTASILPELVPAMNMTVTDILERPFVIVRMLSDEGEVARCVPSEVCRIPVVPLDGKKPTVGQIGYTFINKKLCQCVVEFFEKDEVTVYLPHDDSVSRISLANLLMPMTKNAERLQLETSQVLPTQVPAVHGNVTRSRPSCSASLSDAFVISRLLIILSCLAENETLANAVCGTTTNLLPLLHLLASVTIGNDAPSDFIADVRSAIARTTNCLGGPSAEQVALPLIPTFSVDPSNARNNPFNGKQQMLVNWFGDMSNTNEETGSSPAESKAISSSVVVRILEEATDSDADSKSGTRGELVSSGRRQDERFVQVRPQECIPMKQCLGHPWWQLRDGLPCSVAEHTTRVLLHQKFSRNGLEEELSELHGRIGTTLFPVPLVSMEGEWHGELIDNRRTSYTIAFNLDGKGNGTGRVVDWHGNVSQAFIIARHERYSRQVNLVAIYPIVPHAYSELPEEDKDDGASNTRPTGQADQADKPESPTDSSAAATARQLESLKNYLTTLVHPQACGATTTTTTKTTSVSNPSSPTGNAPSSSSESSLPQGRQHGSFDVAQSTTTTPSAATTTTTTTAAATSVGSPPIILKTHTIADSANKKPQPPKEAPKSPDTVATTVVCNGVSYREIAAALQSPTLSRLKQWVMSGSMDADGQRVSGTWKFGSQSGSFTIHSLRKVTPLALTTPDAHVEPLPDCEDVVVPVAPKLDITSCMHRLVVQLARHLLLVHVSKTQKFTDDVTRSIVRYHTHPLSDYLIASMNDHHPLRFLRILYETAVQIIRPDTTPWDAANISTIASKCIQLRSDILTVCPSLFWDAVHAVVFASHRSSVDYRCVALHNLAQLVTITQKTTANARRVDGAGEDGYGSVLRQLLSALLSWVNEHTQNAVGLSVVRRDVSAGVELALCADASLVDDIVQHIPLPALRTMIDLARSLKAGETLPGIVDEGYGVDLGTSAKGNESGRRASSSASPFDASNNQVLLPAAMRRAPSQNPNVSSASQRIAASLPNGVGAGTVSDAAGSRSNDRPAPPLPPILPREEHAGGGPQTSTVAPLSPLGGSVMRGSANTVEVVCPFGEYTEGELRVGKITSVTSAENGRRYYEVTLPERVMAPFAIGWGTQKHSDFPSQHVGSDNFSFAFTGSQVATKTSREDYRILGNVGLTVVVGCLLDLEQKMVAWSVNGYVGSFIPLPIDTGGKPLWPFASIGSCDGMKISLSASQFQFAPEGFTDLIGNRSGVHICVYDRTWRSTLPVQPISFYTHLAAYLTEVEILKTSKASQGAQNPNSSVSALSSISLEIPERALLSRFRMFERLTPEDLQRYTQVVRVAESCMSTSRCFIDLDNDEVDGTLANSFLFLKQLVTRQFRKRMAEVPGIEKNNSTLQVVWIHAMDLISPQPRTPEVALEHTVLSQLYKQIGSLTETQMLTTPLFKVQLQMTSSTFTPQDVGGPYRQMWTLVADEIMTHPDSSYPNTNYHRNPLFRFVSNSQLLCVVPDSLATTNYELALFSFLGRLMGHMARARTPLALDISPFVWKFLVEDALNAQDYYMFVDSVVENTLADPDFLLSGDAEELIPNYAERILYELNDSLESDEDAGASSRATPTSNKKSGRSPRFSAFSSEHGESERMMARRRRIAEDCLVHSMDKQLKALREGLWTVIPKRVTRCISWQDLERAVCGESSPSVQQMRDEMEVRLTGNREQFLWKIIEDMSGEQRSRLLCFACGQRRLPLVKKIRIAENGDSSDHLPHAQSCSFLITMPMYTTFEQMSQKLHAALEHYSEMELA